MDEARHMSTDKNIIIAKGISKTFTNKRGSTKVIDKIDLDVRENEFLCLVGPGQCGKTTTVNVLSGLESATTGTVTINGKTITKPGPDRGFVFQSTALYPWLTVMGNVEYGPKVRGIKKSVRREKAQYYINLVGLEGFEHSYPNQLSGGMQQRVGIARAYCNEPVVLFMDQPFGALDAQTRYLMQEEIIRIWETAKRTIVFVTNNIEEAIYLADRIVLLTNTPTQIKKEYKIDFPRPRDYTDPAFLALREEITNEMDKTL